MGFSRLDRKIALLKLGLNRVEIGKLLSVHPSLVTHVISGRRWMGPDARRVMHFIAKKAGIPMEEFFPGSERRKGERPLAESDGEPVTDQGEVNAA